jgi:hypothetical protein
MTCRSVGCEMPGKMRGECSECEWQIVRCESCHSRYEKLKVCSKCTGGRGVAAIRRPVSGHVDEERDEDANGWLSNARRCLEEGIET